MGARTLTGRPRCAPGHVGVLCCVLASAACAANGRVDVEFREVEYAFSWAERRAIERIAEDTVAEVQELLPAVPDRLVLRVDADRNVSQVTSAAATFVVPNRLYWSVDPERGKGVVATAATHMRPMLFHELHHLVRHTYVDRVSLMDDVISEGMASAFERDYAGARYPFSEYPDDVATWVTELLSLAPSANREPWMFHHADGRRWIGFRAGTFLVDRAVSTSLRQPGSAFTVATPRHRRGATTTDRAAVAAGQRPHAASRPGCRSSVLGHPGGSFRTAD